MFVFCCVASALSNFLGWLLVLMSEENRKAYYAGLGLLAVSMIIMAGLVVAEVW